MTERWFQVVSSETPITQGDIIVDCPLLQWRVPSGAPAADDATPTTSVADRLFEMAVGISADVIVMSQACDLEHGKISDVVLCPCAPLSRYKPLWENKIRSGKGSQEPTPKAWGSYCKDMVSGYMWNLFMLDAITDAEVMSEHRVVDFHSIHTIPKAFLDELLAGRKTKRLRLLPPYREHLSQSFARYFMRVGLPQSITPAW